MDLTEDHIKAIANKRKINASIRNFRFDRRFEHVMNHVDSPEPILHIEEENPDSYVIAQATWNYLYIRGTFNDNKWIIEDQGPAGNGRLFKFISTVNGAAVRIALHREWTRLLEIIGMEKYADVRTPLF